MRTNISYTLTGPNLGYSVSGQGGALDVSGAATDLCLKVFYCLAANYFLF